MQNIYNLEIISSKFKYEINANNLKKIEEMNLAAVVIDKKLVDYLNNINMKNTKIIAVEAIEKSKNLNTVEKIIIELADAGISKDKIVGAIGGGLIQDLLTLSASIYKRGIQWIYFPTTLMAMADSCIGGKSSINVANFKNIVGNIYPPKNIIIDSIFIKTLNEESKISGLSEAIKICYAKGKNELDNFIDIYQKNELENQNYYLDLIFESLKAKKWFIEIDEFDQKERQLLNFGHSFAHALEAATDFKITHGVAVSVGMLAALNHPTAYVGESEVKLKRFIFDLLMPIKNYLQEIFLKIDWSIFISALKNDKKNSKNELVLILPRANNSLERVKFELNNENLDKAAKSLLQAIEDINNGN